MTGTRRLEFTMNAVTALLCFGILGLWVPGRWALAVYQCGLFGVGAVWAAQFALRPFPIRCPSELALLAAVVPYACFQLFAGLTVYRWQTGEAVLNWGANCLLFFFALQFAGVGRLRQQFLKRVLYFGFAVCLLSVVQNFTATGSIFWLFPSGYTDMVFGPFVYPNQFAAFIEAVLPLALYYAVYETDGRLVYAAIAAIMAASVVAAASRAGCVIVFLEILAIPWLAMRRERVQTKRRAQLVGQLLGLGLVAILIVGWGMLRDRLELLQPLVVRQHLLISSFHMFLDRPWFGFGLGTWPVAYPAYALYDDGTFVNQAHNDWMQWAVEGGLPLVVLLAAFAGKLVRRAWQCVWGLGVIAVFLHCFVDYPMQQRPALAGWFFVLAGAAVGTGKVPGGVRPGRGQAHSAATSRQSIA
jgi:O-antigen ligase